MEGSLSRSKASFNYPRCLIMYPTQVEISDANRVWLGAYLAPGTIVTPEGFIGFNAGNSSVPQWWKVASARAWLSTRSDIGGGASIMGTVSGGGKQVIRVGRNCLLGANSGIGITLGDGCGRPGRMLYHRGSSRDLGEWCW